MGNHAIVDATEEECTSPYIWVEESHDGHDDHEKHPVAFATLHIEEEGDYGFALPSGIEYFILMGEGGHDDHDDHGHDDHGDDEDHSDDENHSEDGDEIVADEDEEAFDFDPHSWLSPVAYKAQIEVVLNALTKAFPEGEADFKANAEAYSAELDTLDANYTAAFGVGGTCEASNTEKTIVANHNAYAYISERYDIEILTVHGLDPEGEPSPADIAEVVEQIEEKNLTVLYVEEYTSTSSIDSIVEQTGVTIKILYTMELPPKDSEDTYLTLMNKNLNSLVEGMGC
jgi:zinc transport system substrate-binding protein